MDTRKYKLSKINVLVNGVEEDVTTHSKRFDWQETEVKIRSDIQVLMHGIGTMLTDIAE